MSARPTGRHAIVSTAGQVATVAISLNLAAPGAAAAANAAAANPTVLLLSLLLLTTTTMMMKITTKNITTPMGPQITQFALRTLRNTMGLLPLVKRNYSKIATKILSILPAWT